jgi:hypothetical protein
MTLFDRDISPIDIRVYSQRLENFHEQLLLVGSNIVIEFGPEPILSENARPSVDYLDVVSNPPSIMPFEAIHPLRLSYLLERALHLEHQLLLRMRSRSVNPSAHNLEKRDRPIPQ